MFEDDWWSQLSPEEQDMLLEELGTAQEEGDFQGYDFGSGGLDPMAASVMPQVSYFTTKGEIDPTSRTEEQGRVNLLQDYGSLSVDNILSGYAGPGAYDTDAFTPTYDYGDPINLPGRRKAEALAQAGGWQGFVSDLIYREGLSPAEAEAELYDRVNEPDEGLDERDLAMKQSLIASMPPQMETQQGAGTRAGQQTAAQTGRAAYDTNQISEFTTRVWSDLMEDPEFAYQDPESGMFYGKTPEQALVKTDQMERFDKFGLPYPTASYEDEDYVTQMADMTSGTTAEDRDLAMDPYLRDLSAADRAMTSASEEVMAARRARERLQELQADPQSTAVERRGGDNPFGLDERGLEDAQAQIERAFDARMENEKAPGRPTMESFMQEAIDRANRYRTTQGEPLLTTSGGLEGSGWSTADTARDAEASMEAARAAADIDYDRAFEEWSTGERNRLSEETMGRAAAESGIQAPGTDPFVYTDPSGNVKPFDFGEIDPQSEAIQGLPAYMANAIPSPRRFRPDEDIRNQRGRESAANKDRYAAERRLIASQAGDPRLAQVEAMGRAYALARLGRTPFRDAMDTRNTNARRMLSGY